MFQLQEHCCASGYKIGVFLNDYYLEEGRHECVCMCMDETRFMEIFHEQKLSIVDN